MTGRTLLYLTVYSAGLLVVTFLALTLIRLAIADWRATTDLIRRTRK